MNAATRTQAVRFARLFVLALGAQLATLGVNHLGWKVLAGMVVGAAEVAVRQLWPTQPAAVAPPKPPAA